MEIKNEFLVRRIADIKLRHLVVGGVTIYFCPYLLNKNFSSNNILVNKREEKWSKIRSSLSIILYQDCCKKNFVQ